MERTAKSNENATPFVCGTTQTVELDGCKIILRFPAKQDKECLQSIEKVLCSFYSVSKNVS